MELFPPEKFVNTELNILAAQLSHPTVQKYFRDQARQAIMSIAKGTPDEGESDAEYLRRAAVVRGVLQTFEALLAIEPPQKQEDSETQTGV